jgi:hypothetical protein
MTDRENDEALRRELHLVANARAEASYYSLNNDYLTTEQKAMVEAVYQFPGGAMNYAIAIMTLWMGYTLWDAFIYGSGVGVIAFLAARFLPGRLFWPIGLIFGGNGSTVIKLGLAAYALWLGLYGVAAYVALAAFGLTAIVELPMYLWTYSMRRRINAKYGIAKRMWNITFPFEAHID